MNTKPLLRNIMIASLTAMTTPVAWSADTDLVSTSDLNRAVVVHIDRIEGGVVTGELINKTGFRIKDPELAVRYNWLPGRDGRAAGDDPGWVTYSVVRKELAPDEATQFTVDSGRALPDRDDGRLLPSVMVSSYSQFK